MSDRVFLRLLIAVLVVCLAVTAVHLIYAVWAYQHASIIRFIGGELW